MRALILSGGNVKGAFQAGVLSALFDKGHSYDVVAGISVGAINGAAIACGRWTEAMDMWATISEKDVIRRRKPARIAWELAKHRAGISRAPQGFRDTSPLRSTLHKLLKQRRLEMPFHAGRVDIMTGIYYSEVERTSTTTQIVDAVMASTAIPVYMDPVRSGESLLVDGGMHNITPLSDLIRHERKLSSVTIITTQPRKEKPDGIIGKSASGLDVIDIAQHAIAYLLDMAFDRDIRHFIDRNNLIEQAPGLKSSSGRELKYIPYQIIEPPHGLGPGDDYSPRNIARLLNMGKDAVKYGEPGQR